MYIFYDFETSSKELLGQILTYSFILLDNGFIPRKELQGQIRLNRIQLPDIDAIATNKINVQDLQQNGESEVEAAKKIVRFLNNAVAHADVCFLVGFNSNAFDLQFLRNLLIRYGINPYFEGKLMNLDVLHYVKHLAFEFPERFKWHLALNKDKLPYYSFSLENCALSYELLHAAQSHDARADVLLTLDLVKTLQSQFHFPFSTFRPTQFPTEKHRVIKQKVSDIPSFGESPKKFVYRYWLILAASHKDLLVLDLEKMKQSPAMECLRYINANKQFFVAEALDASETQRWQPEADRALSQPQIKSLTLPKYFDLTPKDWDIEYQIHELGFQRIPALHMLVQSLLSDPKSYFGTLKNLLATRNDKKDDYLIQLYNRVYLNYFPEPPIEHLHRYITPRYITGTMLRDMTEFVPLSANLRRLENLPLEDSLMRALREYYLQFCKRNGVNV